MIGGEVSDEHAIQLIEAFKGGQRFNMTDKIAGALGFGLGKDRYSDSLIDMKDAIEDLYLLLSTQKVQVDKDGKPLKFSRDLESDWTIKNDTPHYGLKEHASVDTNHGFVLTTTMTPASFNDTNYISYCTVYSRHTKQPIRKVYADKGYAGKPNRDFLALNNIEDGIMRKNSTTAKLTDYERKRNKKISKVRYIVEQYFGLSHLHDGTYRARFTTIAKNIFDCWGGGPNHLDSLRGRMSSEPPALENQASGSLFERMRQAKVDLIRG